MNKKANMSVEADPQQEIAGAIRNVLRSPGYRYPGVLCYTPSKWSGKEGRDFRLYLKSSELARDLLIRANYSEVPTVSGYNCVEMLVSPHGLTHSELFDIVGKYAKERGFVPDSIVHWDIQKQRHETIPNSRYTKSPVKSNFSKMTGESHIDVYATRVSSCAETMNEQGKTIWFDKGSFFIKNNEFEFGGTVSKDVPVVNNIEVLHEIEGILFETASGLLQKVEYLIFHPTAFRSPSASDIEFIYGDDFLGEYGKRLLIGKPEVIPREGYEGTLVKFRLKRAGAKDFIIIEDRKNTGYVIPYTYTRILRFDEPKAVPEIRELIENELCIF
jgi:hypothetical protein